MKYHILKYISRKTTLIHQPKYKLKSIFLRLLAILIQIDNLAVSRLSYWSNAKFMLINHLFDFNLQVQILHRHCANVVALLHRHVFLLIDSADSL